MAGARELCFMDPPDALVECRRAALALPRRLAPRGGVVAQSRPPLAARADLSSAGLVNPELTTNARVPAPSPGGLGRVHQQIPVGGDGHQTGSAPVQ